MQKKWLTFKIVIAIQMLISIIFLAALVYTFIVSRYVFKGQMLVNLLITTFVISIPLIFCFINIYILKNNYPNKIFSDGLKKILNVFYVLNCVCGLVFLVTVTMGIYDTAQSAIRGSKNTQAIYIMGGMVIFLVSIFYTLIQSLKLKKLIYKNAQLKALEINVDEKDILSSILIEH